MKGVVSQTMPGNLYAAFRDGAKTKIPLLLNKGICINMLFLISFCTC